MRKLITILCLLAALLLAFTVQAESTDALSMLEDLAPETMFAPIPWDVRSSPNVPLADAFLPENAGYHDDSIDVRVSTFRRSGTTVMRVDVSISDPSQLRADTYGTRAPWQTATAVSNQARKLNSVLAINGDFFSQHDEGIIFRKGVRMRFNPSIRRDALIVDEAGDMHIITACRRDDWNAYIDAGGTVVHSFAFGPALVLDGQINPDLAATKMNIGPRKKTQRIAIGQTGPLRYTILACEGPENESGAGFTVQEMAECCIEQGMTMAYNLDGGSSVQVVLGNNKINGLNNRKVRQVSDCIWFATLVTGE